MALPSLSLTQQQRQIMTLAPQLRQSLEMLQMPVMELRLAILKEMEINPTIEGVSTPDEVAIADVQPDPPDTHVTDKGLDFDPDVDAILRADDHWRDYFLQGMENAPYHEDADERQNYIFNSIRQEVSLQDHLLEQLVLSPLNKEEREIGITVIGNISNDGYFTGSIPDIAMISEHSETEILKVLHVIQGFDPPGVGARTLRETLLLQLDTIQDSPWKKKARALVDNHLEALAGKQETHLRKVLQLNEDELEQVIALIKSLDPRPGQAFSSEVSEYVQPEVFVVRDKDRYIARVDDSNLPQIRISRRYRAMLEDPNLSTEIKTYIRDRIRAGAFLVRSIHQRQDTIRKIAQEIVDRQTEFMQSGVDNLQPMTMTEVAEQVGVHETTVSRTVANKYISTPQGVYEMKYFFTTGLKSKDGSSVSNRSIQELIKRMIEEESSTQPLSDLAIERELGKQGIEVARRTVAKYRSILKIPPSHQRRLR